MQLEGIDHVAVGVRDIEQSAKWYIDVLGFERLHEGMWDGVPTFIGKGNTGIALFPAKPRFKTDIAQVTANFECFISLFARTERIFSWRSASWKSAESNSNSKTTKFRTPSISAIPMGISLRLRLTNCQVKMTRRYLRHAAAAVLVFFPAAAGAWFVAADLRY